jgi:hypothetical protein
MVELLEGKGALHLPKMRQLWTSGGNRYYSQRTGSRAKRLCWKAMVGAPVFGKPNREERVIALR